MPKQKRDDTSWWDGLRGVIQTNIGGMEVGRAVHCRGYSLLDDLMGHASFFQTLILNVTGRFPKKEMSQWLEAVFLCVSYPDARIWCNQIGSLAGTMQCSPVAGVSAGILAADSRMYGPGTLTAGVEFIRDALSKKKLGKSTKLIIEEFPRKSLNGKPLIPGYIRPLISGDERIIALEKMTLELGFEKDEHLQLGYKVAEELEGQYQEGMNAMGYVTAFLCDQGFTGNEQYRLLSVMVHSGVQACYAEAADRPPESFFPLHCNDIDYQGQPQRKVPEKNGIR